MSELAKAQKKAMEDQGRLPGDWQVNDAADAVLEELLIEGGHKDLVEEGFSEFVENEERRYAAGLAGKVSRMDKETLAAQISNLQEIADQRGVELETLKAAAPVDRAVRKLVTEFFSELERKPRLLKLLRKVPLLRILFQGLADLLKVDLKFSSQEMSLELKEVVKSNVGCDSKGKKENDHQLMEM